MDAITKITLSEDITLITLRNAPSSMAFISTVFSEIASSGINVDMISQTAPIGGRISLSFTIPDDCLPEILNIFARLRTIYPDIKTDITSGNCKFSFFGEIMRSTPGIAADVFAKIAKLQIEVIIITTSEIDISLLIPKADYQSVSQAFEDAFGLKIER